MANADELNATLAVIKENPDGWDQDADYISRCGSIAACFHGWTLLRHNYNARFMGADEIHEVVEGILEITSCESYALAYYSLDSIEALELRVKEIVAGEWTEQRYFDEVMG